MELLPNVRLISAFSMKGRKVVFWLHLISGLVAGVVIAVMSVTGILVAFEAELVEWLDRDVLRAAPAGDQVERLSVDQIVEAVREAHPEPALTALQWSDRPDRAWQASFGRNRKRYVDPYSGEVRAPNSTTAENWMHRMIEWHRWLGMSGDGRAVGRALTGACNLAFLFLVLSGLYLWFPRRWKWKSLRPILWFVGRYQGRAREWNWHNVIGFWCGPVLLVLVATGVVISYPWAGNLVYRIAGEEPPAPRRGPPGGTSPRVIEQLAVDAPLLSLEAQSQVAREGFPDWESVTLRLGTAGPDGPVPATVFTIRTTGQRPRFASHTIQVDPYRGLVLEATGFRDYSAGRKARSWMRFLHTGEAFGLPGKIIASIASAGALLLVWTGFALAWRRLFARRRP